MIEIVKMMIDTGTFVPVVVIISLAFIGLLIMVSKGYITLSLKGVSIKSAEHERMVHQKQLQYVEDELEVHFHTIYKKYCNEPYFSKETLEIAKERVLDVAMRTICLNNIVNEDYYISGKLVEIDAELARLGVPEVFFSEDFKLFELEEAKKIIAHLVNIRTNLK